MSLDLQSRGAAFRRQILSDVQDMVISLLGGLSATVAGQQNGVAVSDAHRTLNFQGAGVTVTDEPAARRMNIYIPGAAIGGSNIVTVISTAGTEKVFTLASGSLAGAPANWQTTGFNDSGWSNSVQMTFNNSAFFTLVSGTQWVSDAAGLVLTPAGCLIRRTFSLPVGTITSATLEINVDDNIGPSNSLYLNGTSIASGFSRPGSSTLGPAVISLSPASLITGGNNVLALHCYDPNSGTNSPHAASYRFTVNYTSTVAPAYNALSSNVSITSTNTWFNGPTLTLSAGSWLLYGSIDIVNSNASVAVLGGRLWDGTTTYASGNQTPGANGGAASIALTAVVQPTSNTTYTVQGLSQRTPSTIIANEGVLGVANASYLGALRVA